MSVDHLKGRRSGRPKGSKSTPSWVRATAWAMRNVAKPDAVPPSEQAAYYVKLAREDPVRFGEWLIARDTWLTARDARRHAAARDAEKRFVAVPPTAKHDLYLTGQEARRVKVLAIPWVGSDLP